MKESTGTSGFLASTLTDLMTSLAVIFILLSVVFIHNASKRGERGKEAIRNSLSELLAKNQLPIRQDPGDPLTIAVSVGENVLKFPIASSEISQAGAEFLEQFIPPLSKQLCSDEIREKIDAVIIEGHTDRSGETNANGTQKNIRLSQERSFAVLSRALRSVEKQPELSECLLELVSATGRGSRVPVIQEGVYQPEQSRRVDIKIRVRSSEQEFLAGLKRTVSGN